MEPLANLNGKIMPLREVMVPALDRGFLFGDAVYEGMHLADGKVRFLARHMKRLERSLGELRITGVNLPRLQDRLLETVAASGFAEAFIYVQISRGAGPTRTHYFPTQATPTEFLFVEEFRDPYGEQRKTGVSVITFPDLRWGRCDIKTVNLLGNALAAQAAREHGAAEAILVKPDGTITEGSRTSFFGVMKGVIRTGPLTPAILPGVTRGFELELIAELGLPLVQSHLHKSELDSADELFLTGTTAEVLPIVKVDGKTVGNGQPGPITRKLQTAFQEAVRTRG
jgi:D-alanine transaminase